MRTNKKVGRAARQLYRLCLVNGIVDGNRARRVSQRLASTRRRGSMGILAAFRRLLDLDHDRHTALVESTTPLTAAMCDQILADLARVYGPGLQTSFTVNPELLGGVRIEVASDVYDGSLRGRLAALEARL